MKERNQLLKQRSRDLRKAMTKEERKLWYEFLREFPLQVHRQRVFEPYIVDFYISEKKLVIELDGTQHFLEEGQQYDQKRDEFLKSKGLTVLRFSNRDVNQQFRSVCQAIWLACFGTEEMPSPAGEGGRAKP